MIAPKRLLAIVAIAASIAIALVLSKHFLAGLSDPYGVDEAPPEGAERVLFIGNSHTFYNDLPGMVKRMAWENDETPALAVDEVTKGGASLGDHLPNRELEAVVRGGEYDVVVIQANSLEPVTDPEGYVERFGVMADWSEEGGALPLLYELWPRQEGSEVYQQPWMPGTQEETARRIREASVEAVRGTTARVAPVGGVWERSRRQAMPIELYQSDGNHPTVEGTYLAALVIYGTIDEAALSGPPWAPGEISDGDAELLGGLAGESLATED